MLPKLLPPGIGKWSGSGPPLLPGNPPGMNGSNLAPGGTAPLQLGLKWAFFVHFKLLNLGSIPGPGKSLSGRRILPRGGSISIPPPGPKGANGCKSLSPTLKGSGIMGLKIFKLVFCVEWREQYLSIHSGKYHWLLWHIHRRWLISTWLHRIGLHLNVSLAFTFSWFDHLWPKKCSLSVRI